MSPAAQQQTIVFRKSILARSVSAAILASVAGTGVAQEIEEVIVTATKREENIRDVPLAITAFTGDFVKDVNLDDVKDLVSFSPGVTGNSKDAFIDAISVRGVRTQDFGTGGDPSAAFFKNDLYEGRNGAVVTSLYDLERAEVLRGPQGFLFGRNAVGGAFSVHTKRPTLDGSRDGYVEVDAGERSLLNVQGGFNAAASENLAFRFAGYYSTEDGYATNVFDGSDQIGHDKIAGRLSAVYAKDNLEVFATAEYEDSDRDGSVYRISEISPRTAEWELRLGAANMPGDGRDFNSDQFGGTADDAQILTLGLHVDYDFDNVTLSWSSGYKDHDYFYAEDYDGTPVNAGVYQQDQSGDYLQSELRLTSTTDGPLSWYAGVSLYNEDIDYKATSIFDEEVICAYYGYYYYGPVGCAEYFSYLQFYYPTIPDFAPSSDGTMTEETFIRGKYSGWAAYVDLTYEINDQWDVSVGVRHSYDEKEFFARTPQPESLLQSYFLPGYMTTGLSDKSDWNGTTPRVILRYRPNEDTMVFASYTEGYKSGGFGTFSLDPAVFQCFCDGPDAPLTPADGFRPAQFRPEDVKSYELGYKGLLADGRVSWDITGFLYDYTDLQVNFFDDGAKVGNAGDVDGKGVETTLQVAFTDNWDFVISAGWLDTEARGIQFLCGGAPDAGGLLDGNEEACEGNKLYWAPDFSGSAVLSADFPAANGAWVGSVETFWESERGRGYEDVIDSEIDAFQEWALRVGYESNNNWNVLAYVENLTDELTFDGAANNGDITPAFFFGPSRPRTFGVRFGYQFD